MNANVENPARAPRDQAFISDLAALRSRARDHIMKGAVTPSYPEEDRKAIVEEHAEDLVDLLEDLPKD